MQRALQIFEESIRSENTRKYYKKHLASFFKFTKSESYDSLVLKDPKSIQILIEDYVMYLKKRCRLGDLNPNSVKIMLAPIFMFFEQNEVTIGTRRIKRMYPEGVAPKGAKPYTTNEIQKLLDAGDLRAKALILFVSSTGARPAVLDDPVLRRKHITDMGDGILCFKVYEGSMQEDYLFTTPEATDVINEYFDFRKSNGEKITDESPIFRNYLIKTAGWKDVKPLKSNASNLIIFRLLRKVGMRKEGKTSKTHYDQALFGGFRKRYDTILNKVGVKPSFKEKLMLHKQTLDGKHYFKPTPEELVEEYKKAILELTISESVRLKIENENKDKKIQELESDKKRIAELELMFKATNAESELKFKNIIELLKRIPVS